MHITFCLQVHSTALPLVLGCLHGPGAVEVRCAAIVHVLTHTCKLALRLQPSKAHRDGISVAFLFPTHARAARAARAHLPFSLCQPIAPRALSTAIPPRPPRPVPLLPRLSKSILFLARTQKSLVGTTGPPPLQVAHKIAGPERGSQRPGGGGGGGGFL
jgi:hypothetical protein